MLKTKMASAIAATVALSAFAGAADAAIVGLSVTEVMSSGGTADWFELTNTTSDAISISSFRMDDGSNAFGSSVAMSGITSIAAHESVVFLQDGTPTTIASFRSFWGGSALAPTQIGSYIDAGSGVGLSSGGDGVTVFDSSGAQVDRVTFGSATSGRSFGYDPDTQTFGALSTVGQFGVFTSANAANNIGSPGIAVAPVPLPAAGFLLLSGLGLLGPLARRKRS